MRFDKLPGIAQGFGRRTRLFKQVCVAGALALLLLAVGCSQSLPTGEAYESLDSASFIRIQSESELDIREAASGNMLVARYTIEEDDRLRVVMDVLGTTQAVYYEITEDGLEAPNGAVLYSSGRIEEARQAAELAKQQAAAEEKAKREAETEEAFSWLTENKNHLDGLRTKLEEIKAGRVS